MSMTERLGQDAAATAGGRRECKIFWQIAPGTPFADLPSHWTCPNCSATKDQFLVLADD